MDDNIIFGDILKSLQEEPLISNFDNKKQSEKDFQVSKYNFSHDKKDKLAKKRKKQSLYDLIPRITLPLYNYSSEEVEEARQRIKKRIREISMDTPYVENHRSIAACKRPRNKGPFGKSNTKWISITDLQD